MAYSMSGCFGADFFQDLHTAIEGLAQDPEEWAKVASWFHEVDDPKHLAVSTVYDKAIELDTVDTLTSPIEVWLCEGGWYYVEVPDKSWVSETHEPEDD